MNAAPAITRTHLDALALTGLLGCSLLWGLNQVAVKLALPYVPPLAQLAVRSGGALLLLLLFARWRGIRLWAAPTALPGLLAGLLFAAEFACIYSGLQFTSASRMAVFLYTAPFIVAMAMPLLQAQERLRRHQWLGLSLAFCGVAIAFWEGFVAPTSGPRQWWGDALGLAAAVLWAATTLVIRGSSLSAAPAEQTLGYQLFVSAVLMGAAALALEDAVWLPMSAWPPVAAASLLFQAVCVTFASYLGWFWLLTRYPAAKLATVTLLTPIAGLGFGVLLLDEPLTPRLAIGLLAVVGGIVLVNARRG